jgi:hypothetical protein
MGEGRWAMGHGQSEIACLAEARLNRSAKAGKSARAIGNGKTRG